MSLFTSPLPIYTDGMTYEEFKIQCLSNQTHPDHKNSWWRKVSAKYLIPLFFTDKKYIEIYDNIFFANYMNVSHIIKASMPTHMKGFFAFEMLVEKCPYLIDTHLFGKYEELKNNYHNTINESKRIEQLLENMASKSEPLKLKVTIQDDRTFHHVTAVTCEDYEYDSKTQNLVLYIYKDLNIGMKTAMKVFGSSKSYSWRRRNYDYTTLNTWDENKKKRYTIRRNYKKSKKYSQVMNHDEDTPLIVSLKFYPQGKIKYTKGIGHKYKDLFQGEAPCFKIDDKTEDITNQQKSVLFTYVASDNTPPKSEVKTKPKPILARKRIGRFRRFVGLRRRPIYLAQTIPQPPPTITDTIPMVPFQDETDEKEIENDVLPPPVIVSD